ncbi:AAA+ ATPase domain-containing protein [Tanacetum coccineum]|uniref:AAA+ ATPase domain-containing protein n=1 Tax=Tanacetum coccineum TaxID=301880 RepID=A0ABQ5EC65_9ASTR
MTTSKLPSLIGIRSILKGWFNKVRSCTLNNGVCAYKVSVSHFDIIKVAGLLFLYDYVRATGGISCSPNVLGDLTVTMKDLSGTIPGTIHYKVIGEGGYENDISVGAALILVNVSVFSLKSSMRYLNIIKKNVVKVFRKDTVPGSGSD